MKNKLIFLVAIICILFGLLFIIGKIRSDKEKRIIEEKNIIERKQFVQDSVQKSTIQKKQEEEKMLAVNRRKAELIENKMREEGEFRSYVNSSIINSSSNIDVSVTIVDDNWNIVMSVSNSIANIYNRTGKKGNSSLLRSSFVNNFKFQELYEGNSDIIDRLKLISHTDYLVIGKIGYSIRKGTLTEGTMICSASITINIISTNTKTIVKSFSFSVNGNGVTESQAKDEALQKLINTYSHEYSTL